ncbi:MAG: transketolase family protein [Eubacteriales bacterium]
MAEMIATRDAYGKTLVELGGQRDFFVLDADLSKSTKTEAFGKVYPHRFINCGIAEGNMMGVAAGIAATGTPVFASTFAMFAAGRAFEQVRNSIGYPHLNVKICATHAGITVGEDGATHQCNEDIALMRTIPGMVVMSPADAPEAAACVRAALDIDGPVYIRLGRAACPVITDTPEYRFTVGKGQVLAEGSDLTIVANGYMVHLALEARGLLAQEGISARVADIHTIKPIDTELLADCARRTGAILTAEEHSIMGGLGSAVAEVLGECCPVPLLRMGMNDTYGKSGNVKELLQLFGFTAPHMAEKAKALLQKKAAR